MQQVSVARRRQRPLFLSISFSFWNEERVLPELLKRVRLVMQAEMARGHVSKYEMVFVNDASTDGSLALLERECLEHKDIVIVNMSRNFGGPVCTMAGIKTAQGDAVVYLDADLQDPPELISTLLDEYFADDTVEVVYTTRRRRAGEHPLKMLITKFGYRLVHFVSEIELPVDSGDYKLLSRRVVDYVSRFDEKKPYVKGFVTWVGFKQKQVFYDRDARFDGPENTKNPVLSRKVLDSYLTALISFSDAPLKMSLVLGFVVSTLSLLYIIVVLIQKYMGWYVPGWPAIMAAVLCLGGVNLMVLGFLGLYVNLIYLETKGRPNYIVDNIIRPEP